MWGHLAFRCLAESSNISGSHRASDTCYALCTQQIEQGSCTLTQGCPGSTPQTQATCPLASSPPMCHGDKTWNIRVPIPQARSSAHGSRRLGTRSVEAAPEPRSTKGSSLPVRPALPWAAWPRLSRAAPATLDPQVPPRPPTSPVPGWNLDSDFGSEKALKRHTPYCYGIPTTPQLQPSPSWLQGSRPWALSSI